MIFSTKGFVIKYSNHSLPSQANSQLSKRASELKLMQRRVEVAKSEAEQAKVQMMASRSALEQVQASLAQSQEEIKAVTRKLNDARLGKEEAGRELECAKAEQKMIFAELCQVKAGSVPKKHYDSKAAWPRVAFSARSGIVLHNRACASVCDTSKCSAFEYSSHAELEERIKDNGLIMCHACRADPGF